MSGGIGTLVRRRSEMSICSFAARPQLNRLLNELLYSGVTGYSNSSLAVPSFQCLKLILGGLLVAFTIDAAELMRVIKDRCKY